MADSLISNKPSAIFLGNLAQHHPHYADIQALAQQLAQITESSFGVLGEAANSVGAYVAKALPGADRIGMSFGNSDGGAEGGNTLRMFGMDAKTDSETVATGSAEACRAYLLMNLEPELDSYNPQGVRKALDEADLVVMMTAFVSQTIIDDGYADVLLPISPFTETSGTFINTEGRVQSFNGVVAPLGETRPAWKVLRVLGSMLGLPGFEFETPEQVRAEILPVGSDMSAYLNSGLKDFTVQLAASGNGGIQRIGEVPIYQADPIVRRADSLQRTGDAAPPVVSMRGDLMGKLGISAGETVRVKQGTGEIQLPATQDDKLPADCIRIPAAHPLTAALGGMFGQVTVERA
jgi:NADH-quinone oxidoreductase subunit G